MPNRLFYIRKSAASIFLYEIFWIILIVLTIWMILSLVTWDPLDTSWSHVTSSNTIENYCGILGSYFSDVLFYLFGFSAWWWIILLIRYIYKRYYYLFNLINKINKKENKKFLFLCLENNIGFIMLLIGSVSLETLKSNDTLGQYLLGHINNIQGNGGIIGQIIASFLLDKLGFTGATLFFLAIITIGSSLFFSFSWLSVSEYLGLYLEMIFLYFWNFKKIKKTDLFELNGISQVIKLQKEKKQGTQSSYFKLLDSGFQNLIIKKKEDATFEKNFQSSTILSNINQLPNISLLDQPESTDYPMISQDVIEATSRLIERKLADFGISVTVVSAQTGPIITRYEIKLEKGIKGNRIVNLSKDLARLLSVMSIRIVETIPGKNLMGLELPNDRRQTVHLSEIIGSQAYCNSRSKVTIALGKDIAGNAIVADLERMPHMLIAGTTGSGKSVSLNAIILSLLYKSDASHIRFILIDPKMLEMSMYEGIPHLLTPVVTDINKAASALNWCIYEMERRYYLMSKLMVRNLAGYNQKIIETIRIGNTKFNSELLKSGIVNSLQLLPNIIIIIDELADLMMVSGKKIEELITRLAQKARAAGIHLILATQRPSVDIITGLIKANIPTRIAFQVSSKIDSRTILDQMGAETLLGQGDMLYMHSGYVFPMRIHGAFVNDNEVYRVVESIRQCSNPNYISSLLDKKD